MAAPYFHADSAASTRKCGMARVASLLDSKVMDGQDYYWADS